jgi:tetratricopeptide (TPR) repeat protein
MGVLGFWVGPVELLAGDLGAAEQELRSNVEALERMGETGYLSTLAADLAEVLYLQGRYDEADRFTRLSESAAAPDDFASQAKWRSNRAKVLARRSMFSDAEALAREALEIMAPTDYVDYHAMLRVDLAEVLRLAGRAEDAAALVREAIDIWQKRGNRGRERLARAFLELAPEELAQRD